MTDNREVLLERFGRFYGEEHFAPLFTQTNVSSGPEDRRPKTVMSNAWPRTPPLADGDHGAAIVLERGRRRNVAITLRASRLNGLECDTEEDLAAIEALELPRTITVRSSAAYRRHYWFRPPVEIESPPYVAFRFESGKVTGDRERYLLVPPSVHPSGAIYTFLAGHGPDEIEIADLPGERYLDLVELVGRSERDERRAMQADRDEKVLPGRRRQSIFRLARANLERGVPRDLVEKLALAFNAERCEPPLSREQVLEHVAGAAKWEPPLDPDDVDLEHQAEELFADLLGTSRQSSSDAGPRGRRRDGVDDRLIVPMDEYLGAESEEAEWLVDHLIARYAMSLFAGLPKVGKSTFVYAAIAAITRGQSGE